MADPFNMDSIPQPEFSKEYDPATRSHKEIRLSRKEDRLMIQQKRLDRDSRRAERRAKFEEVEQKLRQEAQEAEEWRLKLLRIDAESVVTAAAKASGFNLSEVHRGFMEALLTEILERVTAK